MKLKLSCITRVNSRSALAITTRRLKVNLLLEGHEIPLAGIRENRRELYEKHDQAVFLLKALAADLTAHRADTEAYPRYLVRE